MKKAFSYITAILILTIVSLLIILMVKFSPVYVYRLITLNTADVYDYTEFPHRVINKANNNFKFEKSIDENYVESLFLDEINNSGLKDFDEYIEESETTALIFIRDDKILYEKYFNGFRKDSYFHSQSAAKSFISILIGFAIDDGYISNVNEPITKYIPELKEREPRFENISIRNLLMMRSGIKYDEVYFPGTSIHLPWHDEAIGYYHPSVRNILINDVELERKPGEKYHYNNYSTSYLGLILERATNETVSNYLEKKLWKNIGTEFDAIFTLDSKESGFEHMPSRLIGRAIDFAKVGRLFLNNGNWNGKQIISRGWVNESVIEDTSIGRENYPKTWGKSCNRAFYKYQWWGHANCDSTYNYYASGNLGQTIYVVPHEKIIILHFGNSNSYYNSDDLWHVERLIKYQDFHQSIVNNGVREAINQFNKKKVTNPGYLPFDERLINIKGYGYLKQGKFENAILLFKLNTDTFPDSSNAYDSLGEAYMENGNLELAIINYQKSLELNHDNGHAEKMLARMQAEIKSP